MNLAVEDLRFRRQVVALHQRGPRLIAELLAQIAQDRLLGTYIDQLLVEYLSISDAALDLVGGREFPPNPLSAVRR
ncbi:MAG TPA: hypothetical protein VN823_25245 [Stellaceae bacterium]|nr:hypothetical protein [Stellaceae bacterium]